MIKLPVKLLLIEKSTNAADYSKIVGKIASKIVIKISIY